MLGKLLLHPLLVFLMFLLMPEIDTQYKTAGVLMFGIYTVIGEHYAMGGICTAVSVPTTVTSFVSITTIAWLINLGSVFH
jgi:malonate transporter and related proteins